MIHSDPYHRGMAKALSQSPSLTTLIANLQSMIGPGKRFATINAMAVELGMHPTTLRRYMNSESDITLSMLDNIAGGLGVHPDELMKAGNASIQPAHELVRECLDILRGLDERDLPRVVQMLAAYASPTKGRLEKPSPAVDLDALTVPHRAPIEGRVREGLARSGTGQHPRQRKR